MNLIVGLGNPGSQYNFTRHNFGFLALDFFAKTHNLNWEKHPKNNAIYLKSNQTIFIKPQSFYNSVGPVVSSFINFYKINPSQILVICDDFDIDFGKIRLRANGSSGGNNGLKSIINTLKTDQFTRLRLGTNNAELRQKIGDTDFVLSKFTEPEKTLLPQILQAANTQILNFIQPQSNHQP